MQQSGHVRAFVLAVLVLAVPAAHCELVLTYSVQRHGARNVLPKSALLAESDASGGPTLLPAGQQQCYQAGLAFANRYIRQATCGTVEPSTCLSQPGKEQYGVIGKAGVGFNNYNAFANSSALDRTIMSADNFLAGVFASTQAAANGSAGILAVPVFSVADSEDWRIRGYSKCPVYQQRLAAWLQSEEFKAKEQESQELRQQVQQMAPQLNTSLAQWWDVYDSFNVWRTYGVGNPMPGVDNKTYSDIVALAMWLETSKMAPDLTSNMLGGALIGDILSRMAAAEQAAAAGSEAPYYRLLTVSSHYNTQLGVLSALQSGVSPDQRTSYAWQQKIPSLAAVLAFELHKGSNNQFAVRVVYQDGPQAAYTTLPLPCAEKGDPAEPLAGPGSCTLGNFRALAGPLALNSSSDWCSACDNSKVMACKVHNMERQLAAAGADPTAAATGSLSDAVRPANKGLRGAYVSPAMVFVWCLISVVAAGVLAAVAGLAVRRVRQRKEAQRLSRFSGGDALTAQLPDSRHTLV